MPYVNLTKLANKRSDEKRSKRRRNALLGAGLALGGAYLGRNKLKALASKLGRGASDIDVPQSVQKQVSDVDVPEELYDIYLPHSFNFEKRFDAEKGGRYVDIDHPDNIQTSTPMSYGRPVAVKSGEDLNLSDFVTTGDHKKSLEEIARGSEEHGMSAILVGGQRLTGLTKEQAEKALYTMGGKPRDVRTTHTMMKRYAAQGLPGVKFQQMPSTMGTEQSFDQLRYSSYLDSFQGAL